MIHVMNKFLVNSNWRAFIMIKIKVYAHTPKQKKPLLQVKMFWIKICRPLKEFREMARPKKKKNDAPLC